MIIHVQCHTFNNPHYNADDVFITVSTLCEMRLYTTLAEHNSQKIHKSIQSYSVSKLTLVLVRN